MLHSPKASALARLALPAAVVGIGSGLALIGLSAIAGRLEALLWDSLPGWFGIDPNAAGWIIGVLTVVGFAIGLAVWLVPGHAGPDPATQGLISPPLSPAVLPGLALVVMISLGGGISLGPENPIIAINVALALWIGQKVARHVEVPQWMAFAIAGTIGALFGTPVAAALLFTEMPSDPNGPKTWDRLFAPLIAATTGALTMRVFSQNAFILDLPPYPGPTWQDAVSACVIAVVAALVGLVLVYAFVPMHTLFHRMKNPVLVLTLGGVLLGILGAIGGRITLFKGLEQMQQLAADVPSDGRLILIVVVKVAALLIAATIGFRGGRIFPAVFIAAAIGLLAHGLFDSVPPTVAVGAAALGMILVVTRSGWLGLFLAVAITGSVTLLPILCLAILPAWLLVTDRPELELPPEPAPAPAAASPS